MCFFYHIFSRQWRVNYPDFLDSVGHVVECANSDEQSVQHTMEPYTYERLTVGVPCT